MARMLIITVSLVALIAIMAFMVAQIGKLTPGASDSAARNRENIMAPIGLRKIAFVALVILLLGVTSGMIGGM